MRQLILAISLFVFSFNAQAMPESFADLVGKYSPTVVNISTSTEPKELDKSENPFGDMENSPFKGSPFEGFFEEFFRGMPMQSRPRQSLGSGVIISADGFIITNNHVVDGADEVIVRFKNGEDKEMEAKIVGRDAKNDLALIKVESKKPLPFAPLGNSDTVRVGDWVVAIGNPFGLGGTVTAGIVSALGRNINAGPYDDFIQTDAAINPGSSGGALINRGGKLVGLNSSILSESGTFEGIGFATPAQFAVAALNDMVSQAIEANAGYLGVITGEALDARSSELFFGIETIRGMLVEASTRGALRCERVSSRAM